MTHNRATLKRFFAAGARPTEEQFAALIEASLIMEDEGFRKTIDDGLRISTTGNGDSLMSFGRRGETVSSWRLAFVGNGTDKLALQRAPTLNTPPPTVLAIRQDEAKNARVEVVANVAIGARPGDGDGLARSALDVEGAVRSRGRLGHELKPIAADGSYHAITPPLHGCVAFEVIAGVGTPDKGSGRFAMVHAIAMNSFNPGIWDNVFGRKNPIRAQHSYYRRRSDRLQLCWQRKGVAPVEAPPTGEDPNEMHGRDGRYRLMIRSRTNYEDPAITIRAHVTQLWYDALMLPGDAARPPSDNQLVAEPGVGIDPDDP